MPTGNSLDIEYRWITAKDTAIFQQWNWLRESILCKPLGLSLSDADLIDEAQAGDRHLIATGICQDDGSTGAILGGLILRPIPFNSTAAGNSPTTAATTKIRQVAVNPAFQRQGIGQQLIKKAERKALTENIKELILHSRVEVVGFYEKLGYSPEGPAFIELDIPHQLMRKKL